MNHRLAAICAFLLIATPAFPGAQNATQDKSSDKSQTTDKAQIVSTAEILKVDAKKQTLQVRNLADPNANTNNRSASGNPGGARPQGGGGGVGFPGGGGSRRRTGGGYPYPGGGGGGGRPGGSNRGPQTTQPKEYKVYVTKDTQIKLANAALEFGDLHVGDRISISGTPKGGSGDLEATNIMRDPK